MTSDSGDIDSDDVRYILRDPWAITNREWKISEANLMDYYAEYISHQIASAKRDGFLRIWKTPDGHPIAILVFFNVGEKRYETLFVASKHMEGFGMKISRSLRSVLEEETANFTGCTCGLYSGSDHPRQVDWFKFIGFTYVPERDKDLTRYFEYVTK